jgi:hypothetical protein
MATPMPVNRRDASAFSRHGQPAATRFSPLTPSHQVTTVTQGVGKAAAGQLVI